MLNGSGGRRRVSAVVGGSALAVALGVCSSAWGQARPVAPALSSRPGAAYTIYLNFSGFVFPGNWVIDGFTFTPGNNQAYTIDADATTFNSTELANIRQIWARAAQKFAPFNINVTTIDPAPANATDAQRLAVYDNRPRFMHTVVGGNGSWIGSAGVSSLRTTAAAQPGSNGAHTNFVFANLFPNNPSFLGETVAHENGHGLGLYHQGDYRGGTSVNEYSQGNAQIAPIMGGSSNAARGTWSYGSTYFGAPQNDVWEILSNDGMAYHNAGVGRTMATATPLPVTGPAGGTVDFTRAKGVIVPRTEVDPPPMGQANYTSDFWSFTSPGGLVTLTASAGSSFLNPGVPDPGATLNVALRLLAADGSVLVVSESPNLSETVSAILAPGTYYLQVLSSGGVNDASYTTFNLRQFFDMGEYFITGTIVPGPGGLGAMACAGVLVVGRRRRAVPSGLCERVH
jgi:hypothetical protein